MTNNQRDFIRALTNLQPDEDMARIYDQAAQNTKFPVWVERYPMPKGAGNFPPGSTGAAIKEIIRRANRALGFPDTFVENVSYDPGNCPSYWSLWTEWGDRDHGPFWREVDRLKKEIVSSKS